VRLGGMLFKNTCVPITFYLGHCYVCGFDFGAAYGAEYHVRPLSEIRGKYVVDPVEDLRPVCPNCHAVVHHGGRLRSVEEVRQLLAQQKRAKPCSGP
jgi:5-methylcytosine-specific restriction protein A